MTHHVRRHIGRVLVVLVGIAACWALYQSLTAPSRAAKHALQKVHNDNITLCAYFRGEDKILGQASAGADRDVANWLNGLRRNARAVAVSPICRPTGKP